MAFSIQIPIKTLLLRSTLPDAIAAHPISIPCNTLPSSFWAQPSTQQQTGDFPHSIPQNRRASVSGTQAEPSTGFYFGDTKEKAGTKPGPFTTACVAYGSDSIGSNSTDNCGGGDSRQRRSPPSCSTGASDSAIFSISFSERLESISTFTSSAYQVSRFPFV